METQNLDLSVNQSKLVIDAVRTIGTFKPKFNPNASKVFSDELAVIGTAFWLKDYKTLITCSHVIKDVISRPLELAGLLVVGKKGQYQRAMINLIDYQHDLAVLTLVDANTGQPLNQQIMDQEANSGLNLCKIYPDAGTGVSWAGYPLGNQLLNQIHEPTYSEGVIGIAKRDNGNRREIQISGFVVGGYSGSPVIVKNSGEILGVVSGGPEQSGIFMAISFEHIKALAELAKS